MSADLKIWSGKSCLCDIGIAVAANSTWGDPIQIHTGDIVIIWHGNYMGSDLESWTPNSDLTAVVANQYQSFSDGSIKLLDMTPTAYVMGIKDCGFDDREWRVQVVKKFSDVIDGERWPAYRFSYGYSELADVAKAQGGAV